MLVRGEEELQAFRNKYLNGRELLSLLKDSNGCLVVGLPLGVGKSSAADNLAEEALKSGTHDLVIFLAPTHKVIRERRLVRFPDDQLKTLVIRARPADDCGPASDRRWRQYEKSAYGQLGRFELCFYCNRNDSCFWPHQYDKNLEGIPVVFATQAHLARTPRFIDQVVRAVGATRPLVIVDESGFVLSSYRRRIGVNDLQSFLRVLQKVSVTGRYAKDVEILLSAETDDLREPHWEFPGPLGKKAMAIQTAGYEMLGESFRNLSFPLLELSRSLPESREKEPSGDLTYAVPPLIDEDMALFTCSTHKKLLEYRLRRRFSSPFEGVVVEHPGTSIYNLNSKMGARRYFMRNSPQVLDFFAKLVAKRIQEGRRILLVSKKCFKNYCARQMEKRLVDLGNLRVRVATEAENMEELLSTPGTIPLIHYGVTLLSQRF